MEKKLLTLLLTIPVVSIIITWTVFTKTSIEQTQISFPEQNLQRKVADTFFNHGFYILSGKKTHDFLGVNYYFQVRLMRRIRKKVDKVLRDPREEGRRITDTNWQVHPHGIYEVLIDLAAYKKPIYITENGIATEDDSFRRQFIHEHLEEIYYSIKAGADVKGYFYWSLLDNYEWAEGYRPRFGLVEVDLKTKDRKLKESGKYYSQIAKQNGIGLDY